MTGLLADWRAGNNEAGERVLRVIHHDLRKIAGAYMQRERAGHTLRPTALVNEAYLRLVTGDVPWHDRVHFLASAAQVMRHVLVDYGRKRRRRKREPDGAHGPPCGSWVASPRKLDEVLAIDEALKRLAAIDRRKAQVVEMRFFGGMDVEETAAALNVAPNTVIRDWSFARAWLKHELQGK